MNISIIGIGHSKTMALEKAIAQEVALQSSKSIHLIDTSPTNERSTPNNPIEFIVSEPMKELKDTDVVKKKKSHFYQFGRVNNRK